MGNSIHDALRLAQQISSANFDAILTARKMLPADLGRAAEAGGVAVKKTVYNVLDPEHKPKLESLAQMAELLGVPLWAVLVPDLRLHPELLTPGALRGLADVVANYLASNPTRRADIEETARSSARLSQRDK